MLPSIRRQRILEQLKQTGAVNVGALSSSLSVSEMTIHRDLNQLEADGLLRKVRGGAVAAEPGSDTAVAITTPVNAASSNAHCPTCYSTSRAHTQVILHLEDGSHQRNCCPHCGLIHMHQLGDKISAALVTDFISGQVLNAQTAVYIINPDITICCTPTTVSFRRREDAERFQRGFGGEIMTMAAATKYILKTMKPTAES